MQRLFKADRVVRPVLVASITLALAACGGGGGDTGGSTGGSSEWVDASYTSNFDAASAQAWFNSAKYTFMNDLRWASLGWDTVSAYMGDYFVGRPFNANSYHLIRLHVAHGAGLSGDGLTVAVVDNGFLTSHAVFDGKSITLYDGANISDSHGTFVASVISANPNTSSMVGVAYNADLHLTSTNAGSGVAPSRLAAATLEAAALGAVAQNNSWGYAYCYQSPCSSSDNWKDLELTEIQQYMSDHSATVYQAFTYFLGNSNNAWLDYFTALNSFQNSGVVVFALSNDDTLDDADATAAIPVLLPALDEAWITVANGLFDIDADFNITDAALISAPCGQTAEFCLTASGSMMGASDASAASYTYGTGTSYAAPRFRARSRSLPRPSPTSPPRSGPNASSPPPITISTNSPQAAPPISATVWKNTIPTPGARAFSISRPR